MSAESGTETSDLPQLTEAINSAGKEASVVSIGFLAAAAYLTIVVAGTTDQQLFLDDNLNFPLINVGVRSHLFFLFAPILVVTWHAQMLLQEYFLAQKISELAEQHDQGKLRYYLPSLSVSLYLGWRSEWFVRGTIRGLFYIVNLFIPILLLLYIEARFVPYHSVNITREHKVCIIVDLFIALLFLGFTTIGRVRGGSDSRVRRLLRRGFGMVSAIACLLVAFVSLRLSVPLHCGQETLDEPGRHNFIGRLFHPHLYLAHTVVRSADVSARDLRCANFEDSTFENFNFREAKLNGANFAYATLSGARLGATVLKDASFRGATLDGAKLEGAIAPGVDFRGAHGVDVSFRTANLRGAVLRDATFEASDFGNARLETASLVNAHLAASLFGGARFAAGDLRAVDFEAAESLSLQSVDLRGANLAGVSFCQTVLRPGTRPEAGVVEPGVSFENVDLRGIVFSSRPLEKWGELRDRLTKRSATEALTRVTRALGGPTPCLVDNTASVKARNLLYLPLVENTGPLAGWPQDVPSELDYEKTVASVLREQALTEHDLLDSLIKMVLTPASPGRPGLERAIACSMLKELSSQDSRLGTLDRAARGALKRIGGTCD